MRVPLGRGALLNELLRVLESRPRPRSASPCGETHEVRCEGRGKPVNDGQRCESVGTCSAMVPESASWGVAAGSDLSG